MVFQEERSYTRWFVTISSLVIIILFLWNISIFFNRIKHEERSKMTIWASAFSDIMNREENFPIDIKILEENTTTPMIVYRIKEKTYESRNIPLANVETQAEMKGLVDDYKSQYEPIEIKNNGELLMIVYYGNSDLLNRLKYFPFMVILIVLLFLGVMYYLYLTSKSSEQNKLWAGMAKETAHQIGTPLSSLVGWTEILKTTEVDPDYIVEMEKDIDRLKTITERFSKVGSLPTLEKRDIIAATLESYTYLKARSSKLIEFSIQTPSEEIWVDLNDQLFSWTVENLVKNAIDALRGRGKIDIKITQDQKYVYLLIADNGKGIPKKNFKKIFRPGFTSKKRGWGLGLSLAKRIIEEYHNGKIRVAKSERDKGTTFEIRLEKI